MVSDTSKNETLENSIGETQTEPKASAAAVVEKLLLASETVDLHHGTNLPTVRAAVRLETASRAIPIRRVGQRANAISSHRPVQAPLHTVDFPTVIPFWPAAAPRAAYALQTPTLYQKSVKSLQQGSAVRQPFTTTVFYGNWVDQPLNRSDVEASESSAHSKLTELLMNFKNSITLFPNLPLNSVTGSLGSSTGYFPNEKSNGQNYFSWCQSVKIFLEGRHQFGF